MPRQAFLRASLTYPRPFHLIHQGQRGAVVYTCHMAVLHWALMALGQPQEKAHLKVRDYTFAHCLGCQGTHDWHSSLNIRQYGQDFCQSGIEIEGPENLSENCKPGDVLVVGEPTNVSHTMVVHRVDEGEPAAIPAGAAAAAATGSTGKEELAIDKDNRGVFIRGFNNSSTFEKVDASVAKNNYDPNDRNVADQRLWTGGPLGRGEYGNPVYVIPHREFFRHVRMKLR